MKLWQRNSIVQTIFVNNIIFSSVLEIGDSIQTKASSKALADHRQHSIFLGNEGSFSAYPTFSEPIPLPISSLPAPIIHKHHDLPNINVNHIKITGMSASAVVQVGNTNNAYMESRVKHIRHLPE